MKKKTILTIALIAGVAGATGVFAQEPGPRGQVRDVRQEARDARQEKREDVRDLRQDTRQDVKKTRQEMIEKRGEVKEGVMEARKNFQEAKKEDLQAARAEFRAKQEEAIAELKENRQEFRDKVKEKRAELKTKIEERRSQLKEKLKGIRDERKKQITERIFTKVNDLNANLTDKMLAHVEKIEDVLGRIKTRTDVAATNNLDVSAVRTQIADAENKIASARTAISTQSGKSYSIAVADEDTLKDEAQETRSVMKEDLAKVRDAIRAARDSVHDAAELLGAIPGIDVLQVSVQASSSASTTSQ